MAWFEVFIPGKDATVPGVTLTLEAPNWIGALRTGLQNLGEGQESISNVMCDIKEDNSIHVTDVSSHRVFRLREVKQPSAAAPSSPSLAALPSAAPAPKSGSATSGFSASGPKTLLEFQRPDFSMPPPAPAGDSDTLRLPAAPAKLTAPSSLNAPTGQNTIEMSIPWATMPSPTAALPSVAVTSPVSQPAAPPPQFPPMPPMGPPAASPPAVSPPAPAPTGKGYDITLQHPKAPAPAPVSMPSGAPIQAPAEVTEPVAPAPAAPKPAPPPKTAPVPAPSPAAKKTAPVEATERVARAPAQKPKAAGPVPSPTPRGTPAPPPKRSSGQFENAPQPVSRELSRENPTLAPATRVSAEAVADAVADVFDATQDLLMEGAVDPTRIADALLDIALAHIPAESGSFYLADVNGHELVFAAVRGPKADAIKKGGFTVPVGQGIVGFCALEGVCLRVTDIQHDPRYSSAVATAIGYAPRDTVCASAEKDGRLYGAIQLINATAGFSAVHMEVLRYIGLTAAQLLERHFEAT